MKTKVKIVKRWTVDQWLEGIEDRLKERTSTGKKIRIAAISYNPVVPWVQSMTLEFNTWEYSPQTGEKVPSTLSISIGEVDGADGFSSLQEEILARCDDDRWS